MAVTLWCRKNFFSWENHCNKYEFCKCVFNTLWIKREGINMFLIRDCIRVIWNKIKSKLLGAIKPLQEVNFSSIRPFTEHRKHSMSLNNIDIQQKGQKCGEENIMESDDFSVVWSEGQNETICHLYRWYMFIQTRLCLLSKQMQQYHIQFMLFSWNSLRRY